MELLLQANKSSPNFQDLISNLLENYSWPYKSLKEAYVVLVAQIGINLIHLNGQKEESSSAAPIN